ncbi:hypothetical protein PAXINDRAFT_15462 [Paxillus involutus ATCC 200175]|uniref:Uncharacterized protein n=1 Tax=Paxillus involutus ATCC 200175 TaxID=664439 RepID=A0A0C9TWI4_PAXIN|nr:hypothetical protein PAXINDRAFT_15462 [Paxillus involutus ATCC 200175]
MPKKNPCTKKHEGSQDLEVDIPECMDNLPPEADLSILDAQPRKQTASGFPLLVWIEQERED